MGKKKRINPEIMDLVENRNILDKLNGVRLRHPDFTNEPKKLFKRTATNVGMYFGEEICRLNGVDVYDYFDIGDALIPKKSLNYHNSDFRDQSILEWRETKQWLDSTLTFRLRFLTIYLQNFICPDTIKDMALNRQRNLDVVGPYEFGYKKLVTIANDIDKLITNMSTPKTEYRNILIKNVLHSTYEEGSKRNDRTVKIIVSAMNELMEVSTSNEDDKIIYTILRLAYVLATGNTDFTVLPKFKKIEGVKMECNNESILLALGDAIDESEKFKDRPMVYKAYLMALPLAFSKYNLNKCDAMSTAIGAIYFVDWVLQDDAVHKSIKRFLKQIKEDKKENKDNKEKGLNIKLLNQVTKAEKKEISADKTKL